MSLKTIKKYVDFIGDDDFCRQFLPDMPFESTRKGEIESFAFSQSPDYIKVKLRDYQLEGLNWLIKMHESRINCILADEMGLGKTLQTVSLLGYVRLIKGEKGRHLVVVPKSCLQNWATEFEQFVPGMCVKIFHTSKANIAQEAKEMMSKKFDVVLTTYEMCLFAKHALRKLQWSYVVIDEAHRLKNENSQLSRMVRMYDFKHRLLLTGTPLQNNIHELWALLNFIVPEIFRDAEVFENYVTAADKEEESIEKLRSVLQLFFLRREKIDVEHSLMAKKQINLYAPLTDMQRRWYKSILKKDMSEIEATGAAKASLLNVIMQLKKCCNHPYLFEGAEPEPFETGEHLVQNSGKMILLDKLLQSLRQKGSRVLVFSQMARMIDILEDYAVLREYEYCRIDGKTSLADRTSEIDAFNAPGSDKFLFLLTTRAGGLGINLYTADCVVIFDSDWNPQADLQAQDRAHRIGQQKQVHVFRFITESTVEEGIVLRAQQKLKLDDVLLQHGQQRASNALSQRELMEILATGLEMDGEAEVDLSIEEILRLGEEKTQAMNERLETFKIGDAADSKIDLYQWEGENYSKRKWEAYVQKHSDGRPTRASLFAAKRFKGLYFPEYQFYPREFYELQKREEELFAAGEQLSEEERRRKEELLGQGFNWTKKDFKTFVSAIDAHGNDLEKIKEELPNKTDVEAYYNTFWERFKELSEADKIEGMLRRSQNRNEKRDKLREIFQKHSDQIEEHILSKNRLYTDNVHLLKLYAEYIDDPRCFEKIKESIAADEDFMFDYFLQSRSTQELSKHIGVLTGQLLKAFDR